MKILFCTLHAKYVHSSLALPYLAAACADLPDTVFSILELTVNEQQDHLLAKLQAADADVVLFSCYIWNTDLTLRLASDLKQLSRGTFIVLGGPEVSFGSFELMTQFPAIDCIVRGEGEETCRGLLQALSHNAPLDHVAGISFREADEIVATPERSPIAELDTVPSPFTAGLTDLSKPLVYYETSRGCPFSCAFCLSSIEKGVRSFSMQRIRSDLRLLLDRGAQTIKLVDRTFNYDAARANGIWRFILDHQGESRFHFEIAADLLTDDNLALLTRVPPDRFRFEIGVQSGGEETLAAVSRKSSLARLYDNVRRLKATTAITVHLDLVAGLPGETLQGFLASLQELFDLRPDHIQVEPLKVLKGTAMRAIARKERYAYSATAPYKILRTPWLSYGEIRRIEGISRLLDLIYNSGRFAATIEELASHAPLAETFSAAAAFFEAEELAYNLSLPPLFDAFWRFCQSHATGGTRQRLLDALCFDFCLLGYPGSNTPSFFATSPADLQPGTRPAGLPAAARGERLRYYRRTFPRDYRPTPWKEEPTILTFIYRSSPGNGLRVEVL